MGSAETFYGHYSRDNSPNMLNYISKSVWHENWAGSDGSVFIIQEGSLKKKIEIQNFKLELIQRIFKENSFETNLINALFSESEPLRQTFARELSSESALCEMKIHKTLAYIIPHSIVHCKQDAESVNNTLINNYWFIQ